MVQTVLPSSLKDLNYYFNYNSSDDSHSQSDLPNSLILIMGWYASTPKQVQKYADIYNTQGFNTVHLTLPHSAVFGFEAFQNQQAIAKDIEDLLSNGDKIPISPPSMIVAHVFSNGGVFGLMHFLPTTTPILFSKLSGVIYDSGPCYPTATCGARALSYGITNNATSRRLLTILFWPFFFMLQEIIGRFDTLPNRDFWARCISYPFKGPDLYLYSESDLLCDTLQLESLIEIRNRRHYDIGGVTRHNFKTTQHVLHYRQEEEKYLKLVHDFIAVCGTEMDETKLKQPLIP
mmetsp:Transcript_5539/g.6797  ORF Transcript_5539/g.6797 Transcript_5539/m.6797 type:complete len:290 (+) Transcript_5539:95-964(+)